MSEQIKNKILNMEAAPPPAAWDFIAAKLDEQALSGDAAVQRKMSHLEMAPPALTWKEIEKELDKNAEKIVPINRKRDFIFLRYTAAAVVVGLVGLMIFRYLNNDSSSTQAVNLSNVASSQSDSQQIAANNNQPSTELSNNQASDSNNNISLPETTNNISSARSNTSNRLPLETREEYPETLAYNEISFQKSEPVSYMDDYNPSEGVRIIARDVNANIPNGINAVTAGNNYFVTTGPNGDVVRVSNKLADVLQMFGDAASQGHLDRIIQESAVWKQRFFNLRNKLNKISPSPDNFFDIVQLAAALKDEKKP